jgi:hypothetical protein
MFNYIFPELILYDDLYLLINFILRLNHLFKQLVLFQTFSTILLLNHKLRQTQQFLVFSSNFLGHRQLRIITGPKPVSLCQLGFLGLNLPGHGVTAPQIGSHSDLCPDIVRGNLFSHIFFHLPLSIITAPVLIYYPVEN